MFDFNIADKQISERTLLVEELCTLVDLIISEKNFNISTDNSQLNFKILLENKVVELDVQNNLFQLVEENDLLYYIAFSKLSKELSFLLSESSVEIFKFFERIEQYFDENRNHLLFRFLRGFSSLILFYQHQLYKVDMLDTMDSWESKPNSPLYYFTEAFSRFLPYNQFDADKLVAVIRKLYVLLDYDRPNTVNMAVANIAIGVRRFSVLNQEKARLLLNILFKNFDDINENISVNVFAGLIEANKKFLSTIEVLINEKVYQPAIIAALSIQISLLFEIEIQYLIHLISSIDNKSQKYLRQLPKFYSSIIRNKSVYKTEIIEHCFVSLRDLITDKDVEIPFQVLQDIRYLKNFEEKKTMILLDLLAQEYFDERLIDTFPWIFSEYENPSYYFKFLIDYAIKFKFKTTDKIFEHIIPALREKDKVVFDSNLVRCLIHDLGEVRWIAVRLLSELCSLRNLKKFEFDITSLSSKEQFKLFTSVLSFPSEPKYNLPIILPIIQTSNDFVKEAFTCRVELLTQDYGEQVIKVINEQWPKKSKDQEAFFDRIKAYEFKFGLSLDKKAKIKELNPLYTQSDFYNSYAKNYGKQFKRKIDKGVEKKNFLRHIATNVILAKGGGWKHHESGEVQKLSSFGTSMTLPRSYFISPDNSEWQMRVERIVNWNKFLNEWESIL